MIIITTGKKSSSLLLGPARSNYDQKKKRYSRLSIVTPFQIRPKKKTKIWRVRDRYYDKKKVLVVCLAGA